MLRRPGRSYAAGLRDASLGDTRGVSSRRLPFANACGVPLAARFAAQLRPVWTTHRLASGAAMAWERGVRCDGHPTRRIRRLALVERWAACLDGLLGALMTAQAYLALDACVDVPVVAVSAAPQTATDTTKRLSHRQHPSAHSMVRRCAGTGQAAAGRLM